MEEGRRRRRKQVFSFFSFPRCHSTNVWDAPCLWPKEKKKKFPEALENIIRWWWRSLVNISETGVIKWAAAAAEPCPLRTLLWRRDDKRKIHSSYVGVLVKKKKKSLFLTPGVEREREGRRGVRFGHVPIFWVPHFLFKNRRPVHGQWIVCSWFNCTFSLPFSLFFRWRLHFPTLWEFITLAGHSSFSVATVPTTTLEPVVRRTEKRKKKPSAVVNFFVLFLVGPPFFEGRIFGRFGPSQQGGVLPAPKLFDGG